MSGFRDRIKRYMCYPLRVSAKDIQGERQRQALVETVAFVEREMPQAPSFDNRFKLLDHAIRSRDVSDGLICEFGVHRGESINTLARWLPGTEIHGFDSFEGLPEGWQSNIGKGAFAVEGAPTVPPSVKLHKGWFDATLPEFKKTHGGPISFLHVDCDLYSSTKCIFDILGDQIFPGTVIQFDEYFNYPGWQAHEHRAFSEFCARRAVQLEYLGFARSTEQIAVKIAAIAPGPA
jgi:hypothetical protein